MVREEDDELCEECFGVVNVEEELAGRGRGRRQEATARADRGMSNQVGPRASTTSARPKHGGSGRRVAKSTQAGLRAGSRRSEGSTGQ